jgi:hypothetical protein
LQGLVCDRCNASLLVNQDARYVVEIKVYAAYDPLEVTAKDLEDSVDPAQLRALMEACEALAEDEAMDSIHRAFRFDLCMPCQRVYLKAPLPPVEESAPEGPEAS